MEDTTSDTRQLAVLLIEDGREDDALVRDLLRHSQTAGIELRRAAHLAEGLEDLERDDVSLILLDLSQAGPRGIESFRRVQEHAPDVAIVALTGAHDEIVALRALLEEAEALRSRQRVDPRELRHAIRHAVERLRLADKLRLERLVQKDPLTELLNRRGIQEALSRELRLNRREGFRSVAVLLDLDDFKRLNDTVGFAGGDVVLKEIAMLLQGRLRLTDYVARIGGDEFLILLHRVALEEGIRIAEQLRLAIGGVCVRFTNHGEVGVTASAGIVEIDDSTPAVDELLAILHPVLRQAKSHGKNQVNTPLVRATNSLMLDRARALKDLQRARGLYAVKMPIFDLLDGRRVGSELLSRFEVDPFERPESFFRLAQEAGILTVVDHHCLRACIAAGESAPLRHHVNLFPSTLLDVPIGHLIDDFPEADRGRFCIEISEQQILGDPRHLERPIRALTEAGLSFAIDDVGFGQSSLESVALLEPRVVKLDKSCVLGLHSDPQLRRFTGRLIRTCQALETEIVAEGIETREDLAVLVDLGVSLGQGYLWGEPETAGEPSRAAAAPAI